MRSQYTSHAARLLALAVAALIAHPTLAAASWNLGAGAQTDDAGTSAADASIGWNPNEKFSLAFAAGHIEGDADRGDFSATTTSADVDWQPLERLGFALGYDVWSDPGTYEKRTTRAALYVGGGRLRAGVIAESIASETTAELTLLRRRTSLSFDGAGYGLDLRLSGKRADVYASYLTYDYDDDVDRLVTFLSSPALATRPRLEALLDSRLTASATLLDDSLVVGTDVFVRRARIGLAFSQFKDIVSDDTTRAVQTDFEWPLTARWSAQLSAGLSNSDASDDSFFGGARILFHSR